LDIVVIYTFSQILTGKTTYIFLKIDLPVDKRVIMDEIQHWICL